MAGYFYKNYSKFIKSRKERILDVGCGMGHFLYFLKSFGCNNVTGIDVSAACVDFCLSKGLGVQENLHVIDMVSFLEQKGACFDLVVMNDVIEHLPKEDIVSSLRSAGEALDAGGRLVVKVVNSANPITGAASRYVDFTHTVGFTEESLAQVLRMAGFSNVEIRAQDIWVFNPVVNVVGKVGQWFFNSIFRILTLLYGRKTTKIFTKDLIAVAYR
jgi:2-polyprenyl-3-methyl-5-hydroxy-6-metoxy-1,4-benzoquinol methylase